MKPVQEFNWKGIGKKLPYSVPENYFSDFALNMDKLTTSVKKSRRFYMSWLYYAAMLAGLVFTVNLIYKNHQQKLAMNNENYEMYIMTQMDQSVIADYYLSTDENAAEK